MFQLRHGRNCCNLKSYSVLGPSTISHHLIVASRIISLPQGAQQSSPKVLSKPPLREAPLQRFRLLRRSTAISGSPARQPRPSGNGVHALQETGMHVVRAQLDAWVALVPSAVVM